MVIAPEKQTRYWRSRSPYPRLPAGEVDDGSRNGNTDENNVANWTPSSAQEHDLESPLKRSITWDPDYAPWNTNRRRVSRSGSLSEGFNSDEFLDPCSPCFNFIRAKPTAADHSRPALCNNKDDSARSCGSLADSLKSARLSVEIPKYRGSFNCKHPLDLRRRSRVLSSPFSGPPGQWRADTSTAVALSREPDSDPDPEQDSGDRKDDDEGSAFFGNGSGHSVDCNPWQRDSTDRSREAYVDAGIERRKKAAETMDKLAMWLVAGLVGVWILLVVANLKLAGYEAALKSMH
ncbi:hypothetical protein LX36DRAFT_24297 [Colletotrichum falcatum]|nr:hypothetical protein LX36DRAFT_24297 [Colletotrichum falcatum]